MESLSKEKQLSGAREEALEVSRCKEEEKGERSERERREEGERGEGREFKMGR